MRHSTWSFIYRIQLILLVILGVLIVVMPIAPSTFTSLFMLFIACYSVLLMLILCQLKMRHMVNLMFGDRLVQLMVLYVLILLISAVISYTEGTQPFQILRSLIPFLAFVPFVFFNNNTSPKQTVMITHCFLLAGMIQIGDILYLQHMVSVGSPVDINYIKYSRITYFDYRILHPFILCVPVLSFTYMHQARHICIRFMLALLLVLSIFCVAIMQIRSMLIALLIGFALMSLFSIYRRYIISQGKFHSKDKVTKNIALINLLCMLIATGIVASILPTQYIIEANESRITRIFEKTELTTMQQGNDSVSLLYKFNSGGRMFDEWLPAYKTWRQHPFSHQLFGIGLGSSFVTASGKERRYIHNIILYHLVYHGFLGLILFCSMTMIILIRQVKHIIKSPTWGNFALLACFIVVGIYALFFAIAKLFSFNLIYYLTASTVLIYQSGKCKETYYFNKLNRQDNNLAV